MQVVLLNRIADDFFFLYTILATIFPGAYKTFHQGP